jgi:hypothetical protein
VLEGKGGVGRGRRIKAAAIQHSMVVEYSRKT